MPRRPVPLAEPDFTKLSQDQLDLLQQVAPSTAKKLALLRTLQTKRLLIQAESTLGRASRDYHKYFTDVLGWRPTEAARLNGYTSPITPDQKRVCDSVQKFKRTAVTAGHGTGKTFLAGGIAHAFLYSRKDSIVVTTASTWAQVEAQLWREIRNAHRNSRLALPGKLLETELRISDRWFAIGISTDEPTRFHGFHGARVLVIFDEATGVREDLWEEGESMILGPEDRFLAIGNPTDPGSRFKRECDSGRWNVIRVDCRNHPNVLHDDPAIIPGAVTREYINDRLEEYGSEDSPLFQVRVAGIWPTQGQYSLISLAHIERAQRWDTTKGKQQAAEEVEATDADSGEGDSEETREEHGRPSRAPAVVTHRNKGAALGVDIAGEGSDLCPCWEIRDGRARFLWWVIHRDLMETVGRLVRTIRGGEGQYRSLAIDDTSIGNGVSSRLLEVQRWSRTESKSTHDALPLCTIIRVNFSSSPTPGREEMFYRVKDEMWWDLRESLRLETLGLPPDSELATHQFPRGVSLISQLVSPIYENDSRGRIRVWDKRVDGKEKTKALPSRSPDLAHSLMLVRRAWRILRSEADPVQPARTPMEVQRRGFQRLLQKFRQPKKREDNYGPDAYDHLDGEY